MNPRSRRTTFTLAEKVSEISHFSGEMWHRHEDYCSGDAWKPRSQAGVGDFSRRAVCPWERNSDVDAESFKDIFHDRHDLSLVFVAAQCGALRPVLGRTELQHLVRNARTREDHLRLSAQFRAEADEFEARRNTPRADDAPVSQRSGESGTRNWQPITNRSGAVWPATCLLRFGYHHSTGSFISHLTNTHWSKSISELLW